MSDESNVPSVISLDLRRQHIPHQNPSASELFVEQGPIEKMMREKLKKLVGTQYPDSFDWGMYDEIASRYSGKMPRGGVFFKTNFKLVNYHTSCSKCHYAFEIDSYGRGCIHDCAYCYAKEMLIGRGFWNRPMPFPLDLSEVRKIMYTVFETDKPSKWRTIMMRRTPVRIGSMSDSFMWMDKKYKVTQELLKIFNFYKYPHIVFTRSDLAAHDEYIKIYDPDLVSVQFSISGNNEKLTKQIEPGAPSYKRRLAALAKLNDAGVWTTVRINPFFPMHPDGYFTDPESLKSRFGSNPIPTFNLFNWEMLDDLKASNVPSVLVGIVRLSNAAISGMSKATQHDIKSFFDPRINNSQQDKRYSEKEVAHYYRQFSSECKARNLRFNTCYIGNGGKDYFQYQNLWANKKDCCDAVGNVSSFKTTSQTIPWTLREKMALNKETAANAKAQDEQLSSIYEPKKNKISLVRNLDVEANL